MRKNVKNFVLVMTLITLTFPVLTQNIPSAQAANPITITTTGYAPSKLAVYLSPPTIPTGVSSQYVVFVQLQDAASKPAYAPAGGVGVSLSSSDTTVGTVDIAVTIGAGATFARTWFSSTAIAGTSVITASASGYTSGSATITTVVPSTSPTKLAVYTRPPTLPANDAIHSNTVTVQLQDATGTPAKNLTSGVPVTLASSNPTAGTVPASVTIPTGSTHAQVSFDSTYTPGSTTITATSPGLTSGSAVMTTIAPVPVKLAIYTAPPSVPAVSTTYSNIIFVQLQDAAGNPAKAPAAVSVGLVSSNATVGTVASPITIGLGSTFATANFMATFTQGSTVINATAIGYASGSAVMKTVAPVPTKLVVYPGPTLPANNLVHYTPVVQLQDTAGNPAKAPAGGVSVALSSSNPFVGTVSSPLTISAGDTYGAISFDSTLTPGTTNVTATATGYQTGWGIVTTVTTMGSPSKLAVYSVPPQLLAEGAVYYNPIIVQLQNATGQPVNAPTGGIGISLSSSNPSIGTVPATVTISAGSAYVRTYFDTTYTPGSTTLSAASSGYTSGSGTVTTTGPAPAQLAVYAGLPKVPADGGSYSSIVVVQLQDSDGNPARAPTGGVGVSLWSSNTQVGTLYALAITISTGSTYASTGLYSTYVPGSTSILATVSLLQSTLSLSVTPKTLTAGGTLTLRVQLWPKISTTLYLYYRKLPATAWTLATTITTNSTGGWSMTASGSSISLGTYELVVVWLGSGTYRGAVSEIRSFTRV